MEVSPIIYICNIAIGILLGLKYFRIYKYMRKKWDMANKHNRIAAKLACMTAFMFITSLSFSFLMSLYWHYVSGYTKHTEVIGMFVFIGILPFFVAHFEEVE